MLLTDRRAIGLILRLHLDRTHEVHNYNIEMDCRTRHRLYLITILNWRFDLIHRKNALLKSG